MWEAQKLDGIQSNKEKKCWGTKQSPEDTGERLGLQFFWLSHLLIHVVLGALPCN